MDRQRQQPVTVVEPGGGKIAQMQWRATGHHNFGKLLPCLGKRRVLVNRMFAVGNVIQRDAQQALEMFQIFRRIFDEQAIARLQYHRREFRKEQGFGALDLVDAQLPVGFCQHLRKRFAGDKTVFLYVQLAVEHARRGICQRWYPVG